MKLPTWFPDPVAWLNAIALYFFGMGVSVAMACVLPYLFELAERAPHLGWFAILLVWLAPIPAAALIHRVVHGVLDAADRDKRPASAHGSFWAGLFAWMACLFVGITTGLVIMVIDPPPADPPDAVWMVLRGASRTGLGIQSVVWTIIAAFVHHVERSGHAEKP